MSGRVSPRRLRRAVEEGGSLEAESCGAASVHCVSTPVLGGMVVKCSREGLRGSAMAVGWGVAGKQWPQSHWTNNAHSPEHRFYEKIWWV